MQLPARFSNKIIFTENCWKWNANKQNMGYGQFTFQGKKYLAHRFSWECAFGKIPDGLLVLHECDNPECVNPEHLFLGTQKENMMDMILKGRSARGDKSGTRKHPERRARGEKQGSSKLTSLQVDEIRKLYRRRSKGMFSQPGLAKIYGVCQTQISRIVRGEHWA